MSYVLPDEVHWLDRVLIFNFDVSIPDSAVLQNYLSCLVDFV
jgi:hypothetical protein